MSKHDIIAINAEVNNNYKALTTKLSFTLGDVLSNKPIDELQFVVSDLMDSFQKEHGSAKYFFPTAKRNRARHTLTVRIPLSNQLPGSRFR